MRTNYERGGWKEKEREKNESDVEIQEKKEWEGNEEVAKNDENRVKLWEKNDIELAERKRKTKVSYFFIFYFLQKRLSLNGLLQKTSLLYCWSTRNPSLIFKKLTIPLSDFFVTRIWRHAKVPATHEKHQVSNWFYT